MDEDEPGAVYLGCQLYGFEQVINHRKHPMSTNNILLVATSIRMRVRVGRSGDGKA